MNAERAIECLPTQFGLRVRGKVKEEVVWDDGEKGEVEWCVFTALESGPEEPVGPHEEGEEADDDDEDGVSTTTTISTSILFPPSSPSDLAFEPTSTSSPTSVSTNPSPSRSASTRSSELKPLPSKPPQVHLKRKNGEDFGEPRWSFAGKFNEHLARRLAARE